MIFESPYLSIFDTLDEAVAARARNREARWLGGGTMVIADQNLGLLRPTGYLDVGRIEALRRIEEIPGGLRIGAAVVIADLLSDVVREKSPLLHRAARTFGTRQVRNRATIGGNVANALPDRTLPPCLLALDAVVHLRSEQRKRSIGLHEFLVGPGHTSIADDEIIEAFTVPSVEGFQNYTMVGPRNAQFYPTVSVALVVDAPGRNVRLGLGNAGPRALRAAEAEAFANPAIDWSAGRVGEDVVRVFGRIAAAHCDPPSDVTSGSEYRRHAVGVMARRLLERAFEGGSR